LDFELPAKRTNAFPGGGPCMNYRLRTTGRIVPGAARRGTVDGLTRTMEQEDDLNLQAARVFRDGAGRDFLDHLLETYYDRRCPPATSTEELRHIEGQRWLLSVIVQRVALGQQRGPQSHALPFAEPDQPA
jgi:hypothetical protein